MKYSVIILAAGTGTRMNLGYNKMLLSLHQIPLILLSMDKFIKDEQCSQIILVINSSDEDNIYQILREHNVNRDKILIVYGGSERQFSVYNGLSHVDNPIVLIHDGARPFFHQSLIKDLIDETLIYGCAIPAVKVKDTIKYIKDGFVENTLPRQHLYAVQTPQCCKTTILKAAHEKAKQEHYLGTDEASLIEKYDHTKIKIVDSSYENIKITTEDDLLYAQTLFHKYFKERVNS